MDMLNITTRSVVFESLRSDPAYAVYTDEELKKTIEWERLGLETGAEKLISKTEKNRQKGFETRNNYGAILLRDKLDAVARGLNEACKKCGPGRNSAAIPILRDLNPHMVAAYGLETAINTISSASTTVHTCISAIGDRLEAGIIAQLLTDDAPKLWKYVERQISSRKNSKVKGVIYHLTQVIKSYGDSDLSTRLRELLQHREARLWDNATRLIVGAFVLDVIIAVTDLFRVVHSTKRVSTLQCTSKISAWIDACIANAAMTRPEWQPTAIPPKDWTTPFDGGYHTQYSPRYPLVAHAHNGKDYLHELEEHAQMPDVYAAVNAAQRTAWRINKFVYATARHIWDHNIQVRAMPERDITLNVPPCPCCGCAPTLEEREARSHPCFRDTDILKTWKGAMRVVCEQHTSIISQRLVAMYTLAMAERLKDETKFYFPYYLDFRGRLYPRVSFLSPQGAGLGKAMLEFAEGKPLGTQEAADWLAIHVANSFGHDKCPYEDRIAWVRENNEMLCAIAVDPLEHRNIWASLPPKEAWAALAAAHEWAGYCRDGYRFVSHLPIAQDGTCSGLQHYAALLRDETTAKQVNVAPSDAPNDVYRAVADEVLRTLHTLVGDPDHGEMAMAWLSTRVIDRKMTKRSVMTLPYGSTLFSCQKYVRERYDECCEERGVTIGPWLSNAEQHKATVWLAGHVWKAIKKLLTVAPVTMGILQRAAKIMARQQLPLNWTTPSGFIVQQANVKCTERRIVLPLAGEIIYRTEAGKARKKEKALPHRITLLEPTDEIDEDRQASGSAPNFIHSLDASALCLTVSKLSRNHDIHAFALIHDSYATHAADSATLSRVLREEFAAMYKSTDPLRDLFASFGEILTAAGDKEAQAEIAALQAQLPYGTFDVYLVKDSKYFFA
jgi:DNA-directed RNA polymerase